MARLNSDEGHGQKSNDNTGNEIVTRKNMARQSYDNKSKVEK